MYNHNQESNGNYAKSSRQMLKMRQRHAGPMGMVKQLSNLVFRHQQIFYRKARKTRYRSPITPISSRSSTNSQSLPFPNNKGKSLLLNCRTFHHSYNILVSRSKPSYFMYSSFLTTQDHTSIPHDSESSYHRILREEIDLIQIYLNRQVFYHQSIQKTNQQNQADYTIPQQKQETPSAGSDQATPSPEIPSRLNKSIFHNFQKHLITIIKKYMNLSRNKVIDMEDGPIAFELWQAFARTNSFNKRLLHIVFGVNQEKNQGDSIGRLSDEFPEFSRVSCRHNHERIKSAQSIIRQCIVQQASHLSKFLLKANSSITKFQEFYAYFSNFIKQLEIGPMSKRMSKSSKQHLISHLKSKK